MPKTREKYPICIQSNFSKLYSQNFVASRLPLEVNIFQKDLRTRGADLWTPIAVKIAHLYLNWVPPHKKSHQNAQFYMQIDTKLVNMGKMSFYMDVLWDRCPIRCLIKLAYQMSYYMSYYMSCYMSYLTRCLILSDVLSYQMSYQTYLIKYLMGCLIRYPIRCIIR